MSVRKEITGIKVDIETINNTIKYFHEQLAIIKGQLGCQHKKVKHVRGSWGYDKYCKICDIYLGACTQEEYLKEQQTQLKGELKNIEKQINDQKAAKKK